MSLSRIVMRLARNPGTEFADGDDHRGYSLVAPLDADGHLDEAAFKTERDDCTVRGGADDDEAVHRLGEHRFAIGEYVSVADEDGRMLAYKVTDIQTV